MNDRLHEILREVREGLSALYGSRLARLLLFGSQARGDAESVSDIDVLVVLHGSVNPHVEIDRTISITAAISLENDVVVSCTFVSADRFERDESPLLLNVRREGVPV